MGLVFRVGRWQQDLSLACVIGVICSTGACDVRRRYFLSANHLNGLFLCAHVRLLPGAEGTAR